MSIRQLLDYGIEIQGAYRIGIWNDKRDEYTEVANGKDFEYEHYKIKEEYKNATITFMYCADNELVIEIEI